MLRDYFTGAFCMMFMVMFVQHDSPESRIVKQVRELTEQCEKNLPRTETCVIVALPKSKD